VRALGKALLAFLAAGLAVMGLYVGGLYLAHRPPEGGRNLLTTSDPEGVLSFQISASSGEVLWRFEAETPVQVATVHYGVVPPGFRQVIPAASTPRPFAKGEILKTEVVMPARLFTHRGTALDEARFLGGVWESGPREQRGPGA
jgi:hypothetical protein